MKSGSSGPPRPNSSAGSASRKTFSLRQSRRLAVTFQSPQTISATSKTTRAKGPTNGAETTARSVRARRNGTSVITKIWRRSPWGQGTNLHQLAARNQPEKESRRPRSEAGGLWRVFSTLIRSNEIRAQAKRPRTVLMIGLFRARSPRRGRALPARRSGRFRGAKSIEPLGSPLRSRHVPLVETSRARRRRG